MGRVLVLYDSQTGHTRSMAEYVAEGASALSGIEVRLLRVDDASKEDVPGPAMFTDACAVQVTAGNTELALKKLEEVTRTGENVMPATVEAVAAYATLGEVMKVQLDFYGEWPFPIYG